MVQSALSGVGDSPSPPDQSHPGLCGPAMFLCGRVKSIGKTGTASVLRIAIPWDITKHRVSGRLVPFSKTLYLDLTDDRSGQSRRRSPNVKRILPCILVLVLG